MPLALNSNTFIIVKYVKKIIASGDKNIKIC